MHKICELQNIYIFEQLDLLVHGVSTIIVLIISIIIDGLWFPFLT
jgi:hypothetical protein